MTHMDDLPERLLVDGPCDPAFGDDMRYIVIRVQVIFPEWWEHSNYECVHVPYDDSTGQTVWFETEPHHAGAA